MTTHGSVAAKVREEKRKYPTRFCPAPSCLWRVEGPRGHSPCRKHPGYARTMMALAHSLADDGCATCGERGHPCLCESRAATAKADRTEAWAQTDAREAGRTDDGNAF